MSLNRDLAFLILQFLDEEKFKETAHKLEEESGLFFNMRYFLDGVINGEWEEVEKYLSRFTKVEDNRYSRKIFFELRKQKYLEALDRHDRVRAAEILRNDLKVFSTEYKELYEELTMLLPLEDFRENAQLKAHGDTKSARARVAAVLKELIEANPLLRDKLQFPTLTNSRLIYLINQSLNWQHWVCENPKPIPDRITLFVDHSCVQPYGARVPSPVSNSLMNLQSRVGGYPSMRGFVPFQRAPAITFSANPFSLPHRPVSLRTTGVTPPINAVDSEHLLNRRRPFGAPVEVNNLPVNIPPVDLPIYLVANLKQVSSVKSMDFHPGKQNLLLVGTNIGEISIWEVSYRKKIFSIDFKVWDLDACSMELQASLANDSTVSVNRVLWSSDGSVFGVAFSKHIVQLHAYYGGVDLRNHIEIDAHIGSVNDLAFQHSEERLCVITCGEDKMIKVWDAATGVRKYTFEGHQAPVYSVCPHQIGISQFIFSTAGDGRIKEWIYEDMDPISDYAAPGSSCTTMAYSTDGKRLFSCGTKGNGEPYIVEYNEITGYIMRDYVGLGKQSAGVVQTMQFDTTKNQFLAAGDEFKIKFWDMDNVNVWTSIDAYGGLPASPCIRFSKEGAMLAVSTNENGIKILANAEGMRLIHSLQFGTNSMVPVIGTFFASKSGAGPSMGGDRSSQMARALAPNSDRRKLQYAKSRISRELGISKIWKQSEINEQAQLRSLRLPDTSLPARIIRMMYTQSGTSILALADNAVHKLWKWQQRKTNVSGKASTAVPPELWIPTSGILMINDMSETYLQKAFPCFALSEDGSYVLSASGDKISLYNINTFKRIKTFMPPPPAVTFLAFHCHDNNFIAIGMENSSIQIYDVLLDKVKARLKGHKRRVTGLAFSKLLDVLVSSYADAQLYVWTLKGWEMVARDYLAFPSNTVPKSHWQTRVQFHKDQTHVLVVHDIQIAVYDASMLEFIDEWITREPSPKITDATYSSDGQSIFTCFEDGSVCIFTAQGLRIKCRISPAAYISSSPSSSKSHPLAIAAHPSEPNQFALGMTDGGVYVLEPLESEGKWGTAPQQEDGAGTSRGTARQQEDGAGTSRGNARQQEDGAGTSRGTARQQEDGAGTSRSTARQQEDGAGTSRSGAGDQSSR